MDTNILIDILGWSGVAAVLAAYVMVSSKRFEGDSVAYQMLNLVGAGLLIINSSFYGAFPSVGVNIVWVGIAIFTLLRRKGPA
jgi:hypothetical protein